MKDTLSRNLWKEGCIGVPQEDGSYRAVLFWVKQYELPSEYGIDGYGRISKLHLKMGGKTVANFDRGGLGSPSHLPGGHFRLPDSGIRVQLNETRCLTSEN